MRRFGVICGAMMLGQSVWADALDRAREESLVNQKEAEVSQTRIDRLDDDTRAMLEEYLRLERELPALTAYHDQLEKLTASQEEERTRLEAELAGMEVTRAGLVPWMLETVAWLGEFVTVDRPFLTGERQTRVTRLRGMMDRADVALGEKFRRLLEALRVEVEYARTLESYRGELTLEGEKRMVEFLRLGRVGLYYLTLDRRQGGLWDESAATWRPLPAEALRDLREGIRMANKQAAPELLRLPVTAGKEGP